MSLTKVTNSMISGAVANVLDYGADPTGAADSFSAITAALASGKKNVYLPQGIYKTTATILRPVGVRMYGDGSYVSIISAAHNGTIISTAPAIMSGETFNSLQDLRIVNAATFNSSIGLLLENLVNASVIRVRIEEGPVIGVQCHFVQFSQFSQIHIQGCTDVGWYWYSASQDSGNNSNKIEDVDIEYCNTGLKLDTTGTIMQVFDRLTVEQSTLPMDILAGSNIVFNNFYCEANTTNIKLRGGDQIVFNNPTNVSVQQFINTDSFAATNVSVNYLNDLSSGGVILNPQVRVLMCGDIQTGTLATIPANTTATITVTLPATNGVCDISFGMTGLANSGIACLKLVAFGNFTEATTYTVLEVLRSVVADLVVSAVTKGSRSFTFTVQQTNTTFAAQVKFVCMCANPVVVSMA